VDLARQRRVPCIFLRFEDVVVNKEKSLCDAYSFAMGVENINDTYLQKRIKSMLSNANTGVSYQLKTRDPSNAIYTAA